MKVRIDVDNERGFVITKHGSYLTREVELDDDELGIIRAAADLQETAQDILERAYKGDDEIPTD